MAGDLYGGGNPNGFSGGPSFPNSSWPTSGQNGGSPGGPLPTEFPGSSSYPSIFSGLNPGMQWGKIARGYPKDPYGPGSAGGMGYGDYGAEMPNLPPEVINRFRTSHGLPPLSGPGGTGVGGPAPVNDGSWPNGINPADFPFPANSGPYGTGNTFFGAAQKGGGSNIGQSIAQQLGLSGVSEGDFVKGLEKSGFGKGVAEAIWNFLNSGAGFNQGLVDQNLNAIFAALQPQINRGEADIMEQFSAQGLRYGSPAAIGLGDYLSQVNLNEGQIAAQTQLQMYDQSINNVMQLLLAGRTNPQPSGLGALLGGAGSLATGIAGLLKDFGVGSKGNKGGGGGGGIDIGGGISVDTSDDPFGGIFF